MLNICDKVKMYNLWGGGISLAQVGQSCGKNQTSVHKIQHTQHKIE
jgi:hypothetical protein